MTKALRVLAVLALAVLPILSAAPPAKLKLRAANRLQVERRSQTIEVSIKDLMPLGEKDLAKIHVHNAAGDEMLCQAVDADGDYTPDMVIFQADFAPGETKNFTISAGAKWTYSR